MKVITLHQPWATLIATGRKRIETRAWPTRHRGPLAIHAGMSIDAEFARECGFITETMVRGAVLCIAELYDCSQMTRLNILSLSKDERRFGNYEPGRYAWFLRDVRRVVPFYTRGFQGIWNIDTEDLVFAR